MPRRAHGRTARTGRQGSRDDERVGSVYQNGRGERAEWVERIELSARSQWVERGGHSNRAELSGRIGRNRRQEGAQRADQGDQGDQTAQNWRTGQNRQTKHMQRRFRSPTRGCRYSQGYTSHSSDDDKYYGCLDQANDEVRYSVGGGATKEGAADIANRSQFSEGRQNNVDQWSDSDGSPHMSQLPECDSEPNSFGKVSEDLGSRVSAETAGITMRRIVARRRVKGLGTGAMADAAGMNEGRIVAGAGPRAGKGAKQGCRPMGLRAARWRVL